MEVFSILFGLIWMFVVISAIVKIASGASKAKTQQQVRQNLQNTPRRLDSQSGSVPKVYDAQQQNLDRQNQSRNFRNVPGATYGSSNTGRQSSYSAVKASPAEVKATSVLLEDRRNDWLAQQLREEAAIKRRGSSDLGAAHEVECAAEDLRLSHVRRHNTNGINRKTFR